MDTPKSIIEALGGGTKLAERLHVLPSAVSNWVKDGFPKSRMPDLLQIAAEDRIEGVTLEKLLGMEARYAPRPARPLGTKAAEPATSPSQEQAA